MIRRVFFLLIGWGASTVAAAVAYTAQTALMGWITALAGADPAPGAALMVPFIFAMAIAVFGLFIGLIGLPSAALLAARPSIDARTAAVLGGVWATAIGGCFLLTIPHWGGAPLALPLPLAGGVAGWVYCSYVRFALTPPRSRPTVPRAGRWRGPFRSRS